MGDLRESVRKAPHRREKSLWLVSFETGQPFCEFVVSPCSCSPVLLTLLFVVVLPLSFSNSSLS